MYRVSLVLASLALVFGGMKASAHTGGPFDNGDFSALLDNSGVYQVAMRFSNGSGFAQFGNNVNQELFIPTTGGTTPTAPSTTFSVVNRSILYYKGVTYLGTCWGMVDHERKIVSGVTNGNSDIGTQQTTTGGGTTVTASNTLIFNGLGFPANTEFRCKITNTHPVLRFNGTGTLSIINPDFAQVSFAALSTFIETLTVDTGVGAAPLDVQIGELLNGLALIQAESDNLIPSASNTNKTAEHVKMNVFGSRIWFVSQR